LELFPELTEYFFKNIIRIGQSHYEPSAEDMLRTYFPTTGIAELKGEQGEGRGREGKGGEGRGRETEWKEGGRSRMW
jgi:hypothetical protein